MMGGIPGSSLALNPSASVLSFCLVSCTSPLTFGSRSLSCCHFCPRDSMVLYSDKRPARFWRKARSMASLKVSRRTPGAALASGTLPNTGFCAEVETCIAPGAEPAAEVELWAPNAGGNMTLKRAGNTIRKIADPFIVINQLVRYYSIPSRAGKPRIRKCTQAQPLREWEDPGKP